MLVLCGRRHLGAEVSTGGAGQHLGQLRDVLVETDGEGITWMPDLAASGRRYVLRAVDDQGRAESREVTVDVAP